MFVVEEIVVGEVVMGVATKMSISVDDEIDVSVGGVERQQIHFI